MGQYYKAVLGINNEKKVYSLQVKGETYNGLKLMEHSDWNNPIVKFFASQLADNPCRLVWVGDYAIQEDMNSLCFNADIPQIDVVCDYDTVEEIAPMVRENLANKKRYFVNHDLKKYLDLAKYFNKGLEGSLIVSPIPLLTAVGNGKGFGDYEGVNEEYVGMWAWSMLELTDSIPQDYVEIDIVFSKD